LSARSSAIWSRGSRTRSGTVHTDAALPIQKARNKEHPISKLDDPKARAATSQTPGNVNHVLNANPMSSPQNKAATCGLARFARVPSVCRLNCGRYPRPRALPHQRQTTPTPTPARATAMSPRIGTNPPMEARAPPTSKLVNAPPSVYALTACSHVDFLVAPCTRGVSAPMSDAPQRPVSCVHPRIIEAIT